MYYLTSINSNGKVIASASGSTERVYEFSTPEDSVLNLQQAPVENNYWDFQTAFWVAIPPQPTSCHVFNWQTKQWEDPRTLQDFKETQWAKIKQSRSAAEYAGFTWDGSKFDSDVLSQQRINGAVTLAMLSPTFTTDWTLFDNTVRTLSATDMMQVGGALGVHVATQFEKGVVLRNQINSATTKEAVEAVVW